MLEVLDSPVHFSSVFLLLQGLTLVILLLTLAQSDVDLGTAMVVDEDEGRYNGEAWLLGIFFQTAQLTLVEQQLAVTTCLMVTEIGRAHV